MESPGSSCKETDEDGAGAADRAEGQLFQARRHLVRDREAGARVGPNSWLDPTLGLSFPIYRKGLGGVVFGLCSSKPAPGLCRKCPESPIPLALEMSGMSEASAGRSVPFREGFWEVL